VQVTRICRHFRLSATTRTLVPPVLPSIISPFAPCHFGWAPSFLQYVTLAVVYPYALRLRYFCLCHMKHIASFQQLA
jgi:hypothetical protein